MELILVIFICIPFLTRSYIPQLTVSFFPSFILRYSSVSFTFPRGTLLFSVFPSAVISTVLYSEIFTVISFLRTVFSSGKTTLFSVTAIFSFLRSCPTVPPLTIYLRLVPLSTYTGNALITFTVITPSCSNEDILSYSLTEISAFFRISSVSDVIVPTLRVFPSTFITAVLLRAATENADVRNITLIKSINIPLIKTALVLFSLMVFMINIISETPVIFILSQ